MTNKRKITHFITRKTEDKRNQPKPISPFIWEQIIDDIKTIIHEHYMPSELKLTCKQGQGIPLIDSNVICFSPEDKDLGGDFVIKRVDSKVLIRIKSQSKAYDAIVAACCLVLKHYLQEDILLANSGGYEAWEKGIKHYEFALERSAPIIFPNQSRKVLISFEWLSDALPEDCEQTLEDIKTLLRGMAKNVSTKLE